VNDKCGKDLAVSIRDRLLNLARERGEDFQLILTQYGLERLLYRLGKSDYRDLFILKGAMLFMLWGDQSHRPTRDVDFLGFGDSSETGLRTVFRELCDIPVEDDGLTLIADSIRVDTIRDDTEYGGMRVKLFGDLWPVPEYRFKLTSVLEMPSHPNRETSNTPLCWIAPHRS